MLGYFTLQPNEGRVLLLFGAYLGTVRQSGFHWANPFYSNGDRGATGTRHKVSLRDRTLNVEKLKVNDKRGNPIEIDAVVVWRVRDTAQAVFDVDDCKRKAAMVSNLMVVLCSESEVHPVVNTGTLYN